MTIMATMLTVVCSSPHVPTSKLHTITPKANEAIREYRELLESAEVRILEVGLVPTANHINFVIEASGLDAAKQAFVQAGIPTEGVN